MPCRDIYCVCSCRAKGHRNGDRHRSDAPLGTEGNLIFNFKLDIITLCSNYCKELLEICNLADIERKIALYKSMFHCNASGDRDPNYIKCDALMIELIAGGLSWQQQDYVMSQLEPNEWREVSPVP